MLGSILRLATLAGTGAGMATSLRRAMFKLAALLATALIVSMMMAAAIGYFGVAIYLALSPEIGPAGSAAVVGAVWLGLAVILALIARYTYLRRARASAAGLGAAGLGGPLRAAALGASMGGGPSFDLRGALERNAVTVLLTAFIAGMVMNNRR